MMLKRFINTCLDFWITQNQAKYRLAVGLWLGILFLGGIYLWGNFLAWGSATFNFADWALVTGPRLTFLKEAVVNHVPPLTLANPAVMGGIKTYQPMTMPDLLFSPQLLLLAVMSIGQFAVFQVLFMFSLGFLGLLQLKRTRQYSIFTFTVVFLLFCFNGDILAHMTVGHLTWGGYFLFPWLVLLIFELLDGRTGWVWTMKMTLLLFFMLLQGSYHQFIWCLYLIGLLGLCFPAHFWTLLKTAILAVLVSLVRLLPLVTLVGGYSNNFLAGFPDLTSIWNSMVTIQQPEANLSWGGLVIPIGASEASIYVGLIGAGFLVYFGLVRPLMSYGSQPKIARLVIAALGLLLLSLNTVFYYLRIWIPLPIFTTERVITRLVSLAFVLVLFMAADHFQEWLSKPRSSPLPIAVGGVLLAIAAQDLYLNYYHWSLNVASRNFGVINFTPDLWTLANNQTGRLYLNYILLGAAGTAVSLAFVVFMAWRENRRLKRSGAKLAA